MLIVHRDLALGLHHKRAAWKDCGHSSGQCGAERSLRCGLRLPGENLRGTRREEVRDACRFQLPGQRGDSRIRGEVAVRGNVARAGRGKILRHSDRNQISNAGSLVVGHHVGQPSGIVPEASLRGWCNLKSFPGYSLDVFRQAVPRGRCPFLLGLSGLCAQKNGSKSN